MDFEKHLKVKRMGVSGKLFHLSGTKGGSYQQDGVGSAGSRLGYLTAGDYEILAQQRKVAYRARVDKVGERPPKYTVSVSTEQAAAPASS